VVAYLAFVTFVTTASSNAVNLTMARRARGRLTVIAGGAFAIFCYLFGRVDAARYLVCCICRAGADDFLRRIDGRSARIPLVQRVSGAGVYG